MKKKRNEKRRKGRKKDEGIGGVRRYSKKEEGNDIEERERDK